MFRTFYGGGTFRDRNRDGCWGRSAFARAWLLNLSLGQSGLNLEIFSFSLVGPARAASHCHSSLLLLLFGPKTAAEAGGDLAEALCGRRQFQPSGRYHFTKIELNLRTILLNFCWAGFLMTISGIFKLLKGFIQIKIEFGRPDDQMVKQ